MAHWHLQQFVPFEETSMKAFSRRVKHPGGMQCMHEIYGRNESCKERVLAYVTVIRLKVQAVIRAAKNFLWTYVYKR